MHVCCIPRVNLQTVVPTVRVHACWVHKVSWFLTGDEVSWMWVTFWVVLIALLCVGLGFCCVQMNQKLFGVEPLDMQPGQLPSHLLPGDYTVGFNKVMASGEGAHGYVSVMPDAALAELWLEPNSDLDAVKSDDQLVVSNHYQGRRACSRVVWSL